jgi:hypothetical protein
MKWILSIFLIILLSCVNTYDGENNKLSEDKIQRMIDHMKKIKNLFRNLEDSDTSGDDGSSESSEDSSDDYGSQSEDSNPSTSGNTTQNETSTPTTAPTSLTTSAPITTNNRYASVQVIGLHGFDAPLASSLIKFILFLLFKNRLRANRVTLRLSILYSGGLRDLQEAQNETAICQVDDPNSDAQGNVRYSCEAPKKQNININQIVVNPDQIRLDNESEAVGLTEINFSEEAALAALNLQNQKTTINKMYYLNNGILDKRAKYFIITGDIDEYQGKVNDVLNLTVFDTSTGERIPQNVLCNVLEVNGKNYKFKCTPDQSVKGTIYLSPMYFDGDKAITLNMTENNDYVEYKVDDSNGGSEAKNNPIYRKSSSGLSGGAIAGIVIACAVVLIIASIIAMMLRKPVVAPMNNTSSVVGLRTVDNYTE